MIISEAVKSVELYNVTGQLIKSFKGGFSAQHTFIISDLTSGMYFVKLTNDSNQQGTIKLIKE